MSIKRYTPRPDGTMREDQDGEWVRASDIEAHTSYWLRHWREFCGILNRQLDECREKLRLETPKQ